MHKKAESPDALAGAVGAQEGSFRFNYAKATDRKQVVVPKFGTYRWCERPAPIPRREIVQGLIAPGEVALLTGAPGSGKSTLAVALARAVLTGTPFLGRAAKTGAVAYLGAERGRSLFRRFLAAEIPDNAHLSIMPRGFRLIEDFEAVVAEIREALGWPRLIVVDTLAKVIPGVEENSAREMGAVAEALSRLTEVFEGAAVVAVHHTSKDGGSARGSSALLGAVDLDLRVETRKASRIVRVAKANEVAEDQTLPFTLEVVELDDGTETPRAVEAGLPTARVSGIAAGNEQRSEDGMKRAMAILDHLPPSFTIAEAACSLYKANIIDGASKRSREVKVERLVERLVKEGHVRGGEGRTFTLVERTGADGSRP